MNRKKKEGILKKISAIGLLAVIIALVIVLGVNSLSAGDNTHKIVITKPGSETNESPSTPPVEEGEDEEKKKEGDGSAILTRVMPWITVGAIVVLSFLIFFVIVRRTEEELFVYTFIIWIAFAIIIPIALFFALPSLKIERIEFNPVPHMIVAIIAAILLPISVFLLYDFIKEGKKERVEPSWEKSDFLSAPSSFTINFKVFDEKTNQPISDAKISVSKFGTNFVPDPFGSYELKRGEYEYKIEPDDEYKPKFKTFSVERSGTIPIPLSRRTGNLTVQVKDTETEKPVQRANVSVSGVEKRTDEQGKALFPSVSIGEKEIKVGEISGVYSSETKMCEIKEDDTTEVSVSIKSLLRIPIDKESKLNALRNQLQDNYRRVSTYDPCIPFYYKSVVDNMVNLVKGMTSKPMLFVDSKNNPGEIMGHLIDAVDLASREIIGVMSSKRNVDDYSAAMKLEKAEVRATPADFDDARVVDYIRDAEAFYNSYYHTAQSKLFEIDTNITRKTGEMNVLPVSGIWRVARTLLNESSASSAETDSVKRSAMLLVADILLDYVDGMLKDAKIIERLKIMVI